MKFSKKHAKTCTVKEKILKYKLFEIEELIQKEKVSNRVIELDNLIREAKSSGFIDLNNRTGRKDSPMEIIIKLKKEMFR